MPKKKKGKTGGDPNTRWTTYSANRRANPVGPNAVGDGGAGAAEDADTEETRTQELRYLQEMFAGKLDPVVVHMIMNDCEYKGKLRLRSQTVKDRKKYLLINSIIMQVQITPCHVS